MKPHIKVIQRNGVDIFVTSSMVMKKVKPKGLIYTGVSGLRDWQRLNNQSLLHLGNALSAGIQKVYN